MRIGARNRIVGRVTEITRGGVMCQVMLDVPASTMSSVMSVDSASDMELEEGDEVEVIVKAVHVLLIKA